jgi:hypothetical protein
MGGGDLGDASRQILKERLALGGIGQVVLRPRLQVGITAVVQDPLHRGQTA